MCHLSQFYHIKLFPEENKPANRVSGKQLAEAYAVIRGLILMGGRPDEMKSGRKILKDYIDGKLCYCHPPPGVTLQQRSDHLLEEWKMSKPEDAKKEGENVPRIGVSELDMAMLDGNGTQSSQSNQKKRPDYKFKKNSRKKKHGAKNTMSDTDGGLAIGRKGGVIRIASNY